MRFAATAAATAKVGDATAEAAAIAAGAVATDAEAVAMAAGAEEAATVEAVDGGALESEAAHRQSARTFGASAQG